MAIVVRANGEIVSHGGMGKSISEMQDSVDGLSWCRTNEKGFVEACPIK